jgi:pimeloyl-ACP methyl ester carboxylesterase/class 3 adenylate cyclase
VRVATDTQYAMAPDGASIAYQQVGSGPPDVLYLPGIPTQLSAFLDFPVYFYAQYLERFASFCRLLVFDTRGSGLSDPLPADGFPLAMQVADLVALLDAAGLDQVSVVAEVNAGPVGIRLAAEHPERVRSLVLNMTYARALGDVDYPGPEPDELAATLDFIVENWGTGVTLGLWTPELLDDAALVKEAASFERLAGSPARVRLLFDVWFANDARADLSRVSVPTLVMHDPDNPVISTEQGRYLAEHISGATFVEAPSPSTMPFAEQILLTVSYQCEFLTGTQAAARQDRILGALLFLDVVGSTERAHTQGDVQWRADVEAFRRAATGALSRTAGRLVNTRGDDLFVVCATPAIAVTVARSLRGHADELGLEVRAGMHVAEVEDTGDDLLGLGVHVAARVCGLAAAGEVWVTEAVRLAALGGSDRFESRGAHELKGLPGIWELSAVEDEVTLLA